MLGARACSVTPVCYVINPLPLYTFFGCRTGRAQDKLCRMCTFTSCHGNLGTLQRMMRYMMQLMRHPSRWHPSESIATFTCA